MDKPRKIDEILTSIEAKRTAKSAAEQKGDYEQQVAEIQARHAVSQAKTSSNVVRLPIWPEAVRAVPNGILRSALFGAIRRGRRKYLRQELLASFDGIEVMYTGERLDQSDLDVWESVLHAVRNQNLGDKCYLTMYSLLKMMGKTDCGSNRKALYSSIIRLTANAVGIRQGSRTYAGSLIHESYKDEDTKELVVVINPKLKALYGDDGFTLIEWKERQLLEGQQLAQWLHSYYASHAKPHPVKIETLREVSGSEAGEKKTFTQKLKKALAALAKVSEANGQPFRYEIRNGLVFVERTGSASQQKHLARQSRPKKPKK